MTKITIPNMNDSNYFVVKPMLGKKFKLYYKL